MKYLIKFNESSESEMELLDDYLLEYTDKYKIREEQGTFSIDDIERISRHKGFYSIKEISTINFKVRGFPDHKNGYLVKITFNFRPNKDTESEFKKDMTSFINRFCNTNLYDHQTSINDVFDNGTLTEYYIAFFK